MIINSKNAEKLYTKLHKYIYITHSMIILLTIAKYSKLSTSYHDFDTIK